MIVGAAVVTGAPVERADEVVVRAAVARVERAAQRAGARLDEADHLELVRRRRRLHLQRAPGVARAVEIELDQDEAAELRPAAVAAASGWPPSAPCAINCAALPAVMPVPPLPISVAASSNCGRRAAFRSRPGAARRRSPPGARCRRDRPRAACLLRRARPRSRRAGAPSSSGLSGFLRTVAEDLVRADAVGIQAGGERAAHRLADEAVDDRFGAGQRDRTVVADEQRLVHELEVAVEHRDAAAPRLAAAACAARRSPATRRRARRLGVDGGSRAVQAARRPAAHERGRIAGGAPAPAASARRAAAGSKTSSSASRRWRAARVGGERLRDIRQLAVLGVDLPGAHAGQQRAASAVTRPSPSSGASRYSRPSAPKTMPAGVNGAWPMTSSIFCASAPSAVDLRVEPAPQRDRLVEHGLRRRAPFVDRRAARLRRARCCASRSAAMSSSASFCQVLAAVEAQAPDRAVPPAAG